MGPIDITRIGTILAILGTGWVLLWPEDTGTLDRNQLWAFFAACGTWFLAEITAAVFRYKETKEFSNKMDEFARSSHAHDVRLLIQVRSIIDSKVVYFLRDHDLGGSFRRELILPLFDVNDNWKGVEWEFVDAEVNSSFSVFKKSVRGFVKEIIPRISPSRDEFYSIVSSEERSSDWFKAETFEYVDLLNEMATDVLSKYENFTVVSRKNIPEAFSAPEAVGSDHK